VSFQCLGLIEFPFRVKSLVYLSISRLNT